jgi:hypothetical protein
LNGIAYLEWTTEKVAVSTGGKTEDAGTPNG